MFNLLISYNSDSWIHGTYKYDRSRVAVEYTANEISERYKFLDDNAISELKSFPALFVTENESTETKIGYITDIRLRSASVVINFEFDPILPSLPQGSIESLKTEIDLGNWEISRTHWAIKDEKLFDILIQRGFITQQQLDASLNLKQPKISDPPTVATPPGVFNTLQVFIVHGHDEIAKLDVANFISSLGLEPIILHMQASRGFRGYG